MRDTPFTSEEVAQGVAGLRKRKAAGPDGLTAEHLQHAGSSVLIWLRNILNCIVARDGRGACCSKIWVDSSSV